MFDMNADNGRTLSGASGRSCITALVLVLMLFIHGCQRVSQRETIQGLAWSPSGEWISALVVGDGEAYRLVLVGVKRRTARTVSAGSHEVNFEASSWFPVDDKLAFIAPPSSIAVLRGTTRMLRIINAQGRVVRSAALPTGFAAMDMAWSDDGATLAVADWCPSSSATTVRLFSSDLRLCRQISVPHSILSMQWRNNGRHPDLIVQLDREYRGDLFAFDMTSGQLHRLTVVGGIMPGVWRYFSDGRVYFLYEGKPPDRLKSGGVYALNTAGKGLSVVLPGARLKPLRYRQASWSDKRNELLLVSKGSVYAVNLLTSKLTQTVRGTDYSWPSVSTDGTQLALVRGGNTLFTRDLSSGRSSVLFSAGH